MSHARSAVLSLLLGCAVAIPAVAQSTGVGLSSVRARQFVEDDLPFFSPEIGDQFGFALAVGDFDGDGADDLATGIRYDKGLELASCGNCGAVVVRYGIDGRGLDTGPAETFLNQQAEGYPSTAENNEAMGSALAVGDFDGDGIDDLAIGVPGESAGTSEEPGGVAIHYGQPGGIQPVAEHMLVPGVGGVPGDTTHGSNFGWALAAGDFDGDGFDDLAIGAPRANAGTTAEAGTVTLLYGGAGGLVPVVGFLVHQDAPGAPDVAEEDDLFGYALAAGDFNGVSYDDLVIGVPGEDHDLGAFLALFGSEFGLLYNGHRWLGQGDIGPAGGPGEVGDSFAAALTAGDFDADGHDDLAVGTPYEDLPAADNSGQVNVLYGDAALRFDLDRTQLFDQGVQGNEPADFYGAALAAGDFDGDGRDDLAVGHPLESTGAGVGSGAVTVLMGRQTVGLCCRSRTIVAGSQGFPGDPFQDGGRLYGYALAAGDFDADGHDDLAVAAPIEDVDGLSDAGAEMVLYGSLFSDGFDGGDATLWSATDPGP